ncbi:MAG: hypothetical protein QW186_09780 [Candidatus Bathyarchaeia archaeon]
MRLVFLVPIMLVLLVSTLPCAQLVHVAEVARKYRIYVVSAYDGYIFSPVTSLMTVEKAFTDALKKGGPISPELMEIKYVRSIEEYKVLFEKPEPNIIVINLHGDLVLEDGQVDRNLREKDYRDISGAVVQYGYVLLSFRWSPASRAFSSWFLGTAGVPMIAQGVLYVTAVTPTQLALSLAESFSESIPIKVNATAFPGDLRPLYSYYENSREGLYGAAIFPFGEGVLIHVGLLVDDYTLGKIAAMILMDYLSKVYRGVSVSVSAEHNSITSALRAKVTVKNNNPSESLTLSVMLEVLDERMRSVLSDRVDSVLLRPGETREVVFDKTLISLTPKDYVVFAYTQPGIGKWASTTKISAFSTGITIGAVAGVITAMAALLIVRRIKGRK